MELTQIEFNRLYKESNDSFFFHNTNISWPAKQLQIFKEEFRFMKIIRLRVICTFNAKLYQILKHLYNEKYIFLSADIIVNEL
jgi:hypothetical protein